MYVNACLARVVSSLNKYHMNLLCININLHSCAEIVFNDLVLLTTLDKNVTNPN